MSDNLLQCVPLCQMARLLAILAIVKPQNGRMARLLAMANLLANCRWYDSKPTNQNSRFSLKYLTERVGYFSVSKFVKDVFQRSIRAMMVGLLGLGFDSLKVSKPVAESILYNSSFSASCSATRRNSPLGWILKWRGVGPPTYCTCTRSKSPSGRISNTTMAPLALCWQKWIYQRMMCNHFWTRVCSGTLVFYQRVQSWI